MQLRAPLFFLLVLLCVSCGDGLPLPKYAPWKSLADLAPAPPTPLAPPSMRMRGDKGPAPANYPASFGATVTPDGVIAFPDNTSGKIEGANILIGGAIVATASDTGEVAGPGLQQRYKWNDKAELVDAEGHGVRMSPEGGVRGLGGKWTFKDAMVWSTDGGKWDHTGWRALTIVSLIVIEKLAPEAMRGAPETVSVSSQMLPLVPPGAALRGEKGTAPAAYPVTFGAQIKPDGTVLFPDNTAGKIKGANVSAGGSPVVTLSESGEVTGSGLKKKYTFTEKGELVDAEGHGIRLTSNGTVRAIGGKWRNKDLMVWTADGQKWDFTGWRAVAMVSLVVIENLIPEALK